MSNTLQFKRRINGASGSPSTAGAVEGEISFNAPGAAGTTGKPDMFFFDGTGWRTVNPSVTVSSQSINLGTTGNIGSAYTTWAALPGNKITGDVVIATFGSPAASYILTTPSAPGVVGSWTALGGATNFATQPQAHAGTDTAGAINPATLRGETTVISAGATDADKMPRLDATGKLDATVLPVVASTVKGAVDVTAAKVGTTTYAAGDIIFANKAGAVHASFPLDAGSATSVTSGDALVYDGTKWHAIPSTVDLAAYVPLAGSNLMAGKILWAAAGTTVMLDLNGNSIDRAVIDAGTF